MMLFSPKAIIILFLLGFSPLSPTHGLQMAINPDRLQLLKDSLSWMAFRRQGQLVPQAEVEKEFLPILRDRYTKSRMYRSFVIAYHQGVLPKLTLKYQSPCKEEYTKNLETPFNKSVTWHSLKKFVFESYKLRNDKKVQYCDFRLGLWCDLFKGKWVCLCRPDAKYDTTEVPNRCVLDSSSSEPCSIPDFDEGLGPSTFNKRLLTETVFNPQKPEGCPKGLQCRYSTYNKAVAKCQPAGTNWDLPNGKANTLKLDIGSPCSIGHLGDRTCKMATKKEVGTGPGYICYNYFAGRSLGREVFTREGFCAHELGSFQIYESNMDNLSTLSNIWKFVFVINFIHPRSTKLNQLDLKRYYMRYLDQVHKKVLPPDGSGTGQQEFKIGGSCNMAKTKKMEDLWNYFMKVEWEIVPGEDTIPSADKNMLYAKLDELVDLVNKKPGKFCKVYLSYEQSSSSPALQCVKAGNPSGDNDGTCQVNTKPVDQTMMQNFADKVQGFSSYVHKVKMEEMDEEKQVDEEILKANPEPECTPKPGYQLEFRSLDTLEGGVCPEGSVCFDNLDDSLGLFDQNCELKPGAKPRKECHEITGDGGKLGPCEEKKLNEKIAKEVKNIGQYSKLGRGKKCHGKLEQDIREGMKNGKWTGNLYGMLALLLEGKNGGTGVGLCDRTKLLECNSRNECDCVPDTAPRVLRMHGQKYESDYCYLSTGSCNGLQDIVKDLALTQEEMQEVEGHYGQEKQNCERGNMCVYLDKEKGKCTEINTGLTGYDVTTTTTPAPPEPPPNPVVIPGPGKEVDGRSPGGQVQMYRDGDNAGWCLKGNGGLAMVCVGVVVRMMM